jgi:hypothetical protein
LGRALSFLEKSNVDSWIWPERHWRTVALALAGLTAIGFAGWVWSLESSIETPLSGTIDVTGASWGENCGAPKENALQWVRSACSGKRECHFVFDWRLLGNPAPPCTKQFSIEWKCSADGPAHKALFRSELAPGTIVPLSCNEISDRPPSGR